MAGTVWGPTRDGDVIAEDAATVLARDTTDSMPLMIGHTRDESTLFTAFDREMANMDAARLARLARGPFGARAADAVECCVQDRTAAGLRTEPIDIWAAIVTDRTFRIPAIRTAECRLRAHAAEGGRSVEATDSGASTAKAPVWMYRFDHESPAREGRLQACHSLDIPFVWGGCLESTFLWHGRSGGTLVASCHGELSRLRAQRRRRTKRCRTGRSTTWTRARPCYSPGRRKLSSRRWMPCVNSGRPGRRSRTPT